MERIGFIGLGIMGKPMARNLLKAGYPLIVHNRSQAAVAELAAEGATKADSPKAVAEQSDVIITMLPDSPDVERVVLGENGISGAVRSGMLLIDMSTIAPATARKVRSALLEKGADSLDAPVSGGEAGARDGTLSIMVGGSEAAFQRAMSIFEVLGQNIVHIGDAGAGQVAKACNQIVVGLTIQAVAEALDRTGIPARLQSQTASQRSGHRPANRARSVPALDDNLSGSRVDERADCPG
jgi:2-hydroxy-3-oxopropionate reductase